MDKTPQSMQGLKYPCDIGSPELITGKPVSIPYAFVFNKLADRLSHRQKLQKNGMAY